MKHAVAVAFSGLAVLPAHAHEGAHVHPHGGESVIVFLFAAGLVAIAALKLFR